MNTTIYHNPHCSKSRETLCILEEAGINTNIIEYLQTPPTRDELITILDMLGMEPRELMRTHEADYAENGLNSSSLTRDELINAMLRFPKLIERPIVIHNGKAVIGRPPHTVKTIL